MEKDSATNRVAVVNGGAGGIGRAVVLRLIEDGFLPVVLDKDAGAGQEVMAELAQHGRTGVFRALDLTSRQEVSNAVADVIADYRRVDLLVNLAGGTLYAKLIQDFSLREWQEVIDVNLKATFLCCGRPALLECVMEEKNARRIFEDIQWQPWLAIHASPGAA